MDRPSQSTGEKVVWGRLGLRRLAGIVLASRGAAAIASALGSACGASRFLGFVFALVLALPLWAQTAPTNVTTITSSSELVLIPAVVKSSSGSHIPGLKKEAFVLKQDGKSKPIAIFEEVKTTTARVRRARGEHGTFSNMEPDVAEYHRLSIIVLDFVNTPASDQANARSALIKFLTEVANSGEPMCLLALTRGGLTLLHDFTDDPKLLAEGLNRAVNDVPLNHEEVVDPHHPPDDPAITKLIREQLQSEAQQASLANKVAASITVQALRQVAKAFRGLPGRKSLIWASSGFPFSLSPGEQLMCDPACPVHGRDEMQLAYDSLWKEMSDAQVAIYSVDLRTSTSILPISTGGMRPSDAGDPQFDIEAKSQEKTFDTDSTLRLFAENTGGRAFMGGGNLIESFHQAIEDDSSYYVLGYYVNPSNTKPGWHNISVAVHAKSSQIRYRNSFFLSRDISTPSAQQDIRLALDSPLDFTGIPVSVTWTERESGKVPGKTQVHFELVMPPNFASVDDSDQNHMVVDIAVVAKNIKGDAVADTAKRIDAHLKADGLEQIQNNGMTYRGMLQLPPGDYVVRFVVRDALGNRTGSVAADVSVAQ
jgi:VWFA-related protein